MLLSGISGWLLSGLRCFSLLLRVGRFAAVAAGFDGGSLAEKDLLAIVDPGVALEGAVILDGEVIAKVKFHSGKDMDAFAEVVEDVVPEHAAKPEAEPKVGAEQGAIEHLPEVDEGLAGGIARRVDGIVVLGCEEDIARVEGFDNDVGGQFTDEGSCFGTAAVRTSQVDLIELIADDLGAAIDASVACELFVEMAQPAAVSGFGFGSWP